VQVRQYSRVISSIRATFLGVLACASFCGGAEPPAIIAPASHDTSILQLDPATLVSVFMDGDTTGVSHQVSRDNARNWQPAAKAGVRWAAKVMRDQDGQLQAVWLIVRGDGKKPAVDKFIDIWHARTTGKDLKWGPAHCVWQGYVGAICGRLTQLPSGRIILPFARWLPEEPRGPPLGCNASGVIYSDDGGQTWAPSPAKLVSPCPKDYNGDSVGAVEPVVLELKDGRVWMLMRTQTGFLYESFSRDGINWSPAQPSRFHSSTGPAELCWLPDGRIVLFWNNCELPPRVNGDGVYGGRDALHAAISRDDGKSWSGFREVYLDPTRNQSPPRRGDRGTAYPQFQRLDGSRMLVAAGQGTKLRALLAVDPGWIEESTRADDFTDGLANWSVFKPFGKAQGWWRDRAPGCALAVHPSLPGKKVLHLGKPDEKEADGAMWNFPAGRAGTVAISFQVNRGCQGAIFSLCDRFFDPTDDNGDKSAVCSVLLNSECLLNGHTKVSPGEFHKLTITWRAEKRIAALKLDAIEVGEISLNGDLRNGCCYLRLRSAAKSIDPAGFLVESVRAEVESP